MSSEELWLNSEYIQAFLKASQGQNVELIDFNVNTGAEKGENFAGVIKRVTVNFLCNGNKKSINYILKSSPTSGAISEMLDDLGTFDREVFTYHKILKDCEDLLYGFKMAPRY